MAVDFSLLPPEERFEEKPPSRLVWAIVFFVLVIAGIFTVLLLWPRGMATNTWKFWTTIVLFPVGVPALIVLRRFSGYEGRREDVELRNEAGRGYNECVFEAASHPFAIVGSDYRFSSDQSINAVEKIRTGTVGLTTQEPVARDGIPTKARWLVVPGLELKPGGKADDHSRHVRVVKWLFAELRDGLAAKIHALPLRLDLSVHLVVSSSLTHPECVTLWRECCREGPFHHARVADESAEPVDLMTLDRWLDQAAGEECGEARLIVAIQLHPLLSASPPAGVAEAGVALLLVPDAVASQHALARAADLHRPVRVPVDQPQDALSHALKWARTDSADIPGGWQTGLDATQAGKLREPAMRLGLRARTTDLDQTVGCAGVAAPWLAVACAASSLSGETESQIVLAGQDESVDAAVVRRAPSVREITANH